MKRENYVAPRIKVLEIGSELMQGMGIAESAHIGIDPDNTGSGKVGSKEYEGKWSDEEDNAPSNAWEE